VIGSRYQPAYAGIPTFFRAPIGSLSDLSRAHVGILGAPYDSTTGLGRPGTRYGPRAIREESCHYAGFYYSMPDRTHVDIELGRGFRVPDPLPLIDLGDVDCFPADIEATTVSVAEGVRSVVETGALPFLLGGDHYLVYPSFKGVSEALRAEDPNVRIGYIHIDSHFDLFDEMAFTGRYNNGTSVRRITECPGISLPHMAWIGINGRMGSKEQYDFATTHNLRFVTAADVARDDWEPAVRETIAAVSEADRVYVSIDIDVVDGSAAPGTGAAVFEGITAARFVSVLEMVGRIPNLVGLDLVEVAPRFDSASRTARLAALGAISLIGERLFEEVDLAESKPAQYGAVHE
jgi:formimidoylglutamase